MNTLVLGDGTTAVFDGPGEATTISERGNLLGFYYRDDLNRWQAWPVKGAGGFFDNEIEAKDYLLQMAADHGNLNMKLDRNISDGRGKYALLKLRRLSEIRATAVHADVMYVEKALQVLENAGLIDYGERGTESEFFVMRLKDENAQDGLEGYAIAAKQHGDIQWSHEVFELAQRAALSPWRKKPD